MKNNTAPGTIAPLKFPEKFGFLTFSTASNVVYQFKSIYYLFFLTNILKIDVLVAGAILTIGTISGTHEQPADWLLVGGPEFQKRRALPPLCPVVCPAVGRFGGAFVLRF